MPSLLERLNDALMPDFHVERELARGGMGAVFLARDTNLEVPVAIKVLHPAMATERLAKRFLQEAHIIAALQHPNIVHIRKVGTDEGLYYYVMDYLEGDTLADRLHRDGALSKTETVHLGCDMLGALEAVHKADVVHRDIKPSNIFLLSKRAVLVDFGIAKPQSAQTEPPAQDGFGRMLPTETVLDDSGIARPPVDQSDPLTAPNSRIGTLLYMPPEQDKGDKVTPQTDICALGMVLYEALTTRKWRREEEPYPPDPRKEDWTGSPWSRFLIHVPWNVVSILARALAYFPHDRWPNAQIFRRQLRATLAWPHRLRAARDAAIVATVVATIVAAIILLPPDPPAPGPPLGSLTIRLRPFQQTSDITPPWLADSLSQRLERSMRLISEFRVLARDTLPDFQAAVELQGVVSSEDSTVSWQVWSESWGKGLRRLADQQFTAGDWKMVADSVSIRTIRELWSDESPLSRWLPRDALPATPRGFDEWFRGERLLNSGQWENAREVFHRVVEIDSSCVLCSWRIVEVDRWLWTRPVDAFHKQRVLENDGLFPPHFRRLIRARLELTDRLDALRLATEEWGDYYYSWFLLGEEEFNRGPLYGLLRSQAGVSLEEASLLRPEFAPIWWDLAWIYTAEGDKTNAARALEMVPEPLDPFSTVMALMLDLGFGYRFGESVPDARGLQEFINHPWLPLAQRLLPSFDAPEGAVEIGEMFTNIRGRPDLRRSGLTGQLLGFFAMGRMDAARERARVFQRDYPGDEDFSLFAIQLEAVNGIFDSVAATGDVERITDQLERYAAPDAGTLEQRLSARWILQLLSQRNAAVAVQTTGVQPLDVLLEADRMAQAGRPQDALRLARTIRTWEIADVVPDRFFRTVLHFLMAEWHSKLGNRQAAVRALRWHEAVDQWKLPTASPVVQEIDWAFGTLARWKRAQLLDSLQDMGGETCSAYGAVARLWGRGDPEYASRAEIARRRLQALGCITDR